MAPSSSTPAPVTLDDLRRFAVTRSLFAPTALKRALDRLGFVQADPIRAPARAQDLVLRHRVANYRAGNLDRRYQALGVQEDFFVNYGFLSRDVQALMHPRRVTAGWTAARRRKAQDLLAFVQERGVVHPREVDAHFSHGTVTNYWGGSSSATTHLLEHMHYSGLLRVARRENGIRLYAPHEHAAGPSDPAERRAQLDALVDVAVRLYAPLPGGTLAWLVNRLRYGAPQFERQLKGALLRAKQRLVHAHVDGADWYWPPGERLPRSPDRDDDSVRLLAPFDPVVWDRRRFERFWGWTYRFEAYTPASKRKYGYYALPLLWRDRVIGWGNVSMASGMLRADIGYVTGRPPGDARFARALDEELDLMRLFLAAPAGATR